MAKIKKWTFFSFYMAIVFIFSGIIMFLVYIEDEVDPNIIPLSHNGIASIFATIIIVSMLIFTGYMFWDVILNFQNGGKNNIILKEGRSAKAKIIKLNEDDESVTTINGQPFVSLTLEIYDGDKKPYQVKLKTIIPRLHVPQFQEGKYLKVKIDSKDSNKVVVDPQSFSINQAPNVANLENSQVKNKGIMKKIELFFSVYIWILLPSIGIIAALENYYPEVIPFNLDVYGSIIVILAITSLAVGLFSFSKGLLKSLFSRGHEKKILKIGRPALAEIVNIKESDEGTVTLNEQPFVTLVMEVNDGVEKYETEFKTIIGRLDIPKFQPGKKFAVKIDPNNKMKIAFDPKREILKNKKFKNIGPMRFN